MNTTDASTTIRLTRVDVAEIRDLAYSTSTAELAERYRVPADVIRRVVGGKRCR